jgi:tetratricopeptide (TPR) repeat protein
MVQRGYDSFVGTPAQNSTNLNDRLFSLSNNGRLPAWKVSWHAFERNPVTGIGAGGFENYWNQHRTIAESIRDAHSLYLETLAETGLIGAVLLFGALALPLLAFRRARQHPLAAGALAAFVVFLVHAIADWEWELTGITLVALFCGGSLLVIQRRAVPIGRVRWPVVAAASVVGLLALAGLGGRLSLHLSSSASKNADSSKAVSEAHVAIHLLPWSAEAWDALGTAQLGAGERAKAIASYRKAISKSPGDWHLWVALAKAEPAPARWHDLATALRLNPLGEGEIRKIAQELLAQGSSS